MRKQSSASDRRPYIANVQVNVLHANLSPKRHRVSRSSAMTHCPVGIHYGYFDSLISNQTPQIRTISLMCLKLAQFHRHKLNSQTLIIVLKSMMMVRQYRCTNVLAWFDRMINIQKIAGALPPEAQLSGWCANKLSQERAAVGSKGSQGS